MDNCCLLSGSAVAFLYPQEHLFQGGAIHSGLTSLVLIIDQENEPHTYL